MHKEHPACQQVPNIENNLIEFSKFMSMNYDWQWPAGTYEIGTGRGFLSYFIASQFSTRVTTCDVIDRCDADRTSPGLFIKSKRGESEVYRILENAHDRMGTFFDLFEMDCRARRKFVLIVDGGDKPLEFARYGMLCPAGTLIMVHDWIKSDEEKSKISPETWPSFEFNDQYLSRYLSAELVPNASRYDARKLFQQIWTPLQESSFWGVYIRTHAQVS